MQSDTWQKKFEHDMDFNESQKDMRRSYAGGATGALASGIVWCLAGMIGIFISQNASRLSLFIGGTLIFPVSELFSKALKCSGKHSANNALRHLAFENLGILFVGLFIAFSVAQFNSALFFPVMLFIIGARYLTFQTLYGLKVHWALGCSLMVTGFLAAALTAPFITGAFLGGGIGILFSIVIFKLNHKAELRVV